MDVFNKAHPTNINIEIPQTKDSPSDTLLMRRERDEIRSRLAVKERLIECRRKLKDIWAPRIQALQPGYDEQKQKLAALESLTEGHPPSTRSGTKNQEVHHCGLCQDRDIVQQNLDAFEVSMKFALHHFNAQTRENERLTKIWDSVKPRDIARLKELDALLELARRGREPEKRVRPPAQTRINENEPVQRLGFGSNGLTSV
ncbi:MAG: hypothetical protein WBF15_19435 [Candidatus Sulfotelmatobacter sp.]